MDVWWQLAVVAALVLANAAFAGSEVALITLRDDQLGRLEGRGRSGRALARLARDANRFLGTIQLAITLSGFLASATAAVVFADALGGLLRPVLGGAAVGVAVVVVTGLLTAVTIVIGELAPKRLALQWPEQWGLVAGPPLAVLATLVRPVVWLLGHATDAVVRLAGGDPGVQRRHVTESDLRAMVARQPELSDHERAILDGAFEFADRPLRQVHVPRLYVVAFRADAPARQVARDLVAAGHTRAPVHRGTLDDVVGVVHVRTLVDADGEVGDHTIPPLLLGEHVGALDALRAMQQHRQKLAVVVDEYGGTAGIVTAEDLVEELVGEIWEETDPDVQAAQWHDDGSVSVAGTYPVHDLDKLDVHVPGGSATTVAGLVLDRLGRLAVTGDTAVVGDWRFEVTDADDRVIREVRLTRSR